MSYTISCVHEDRGDWVVALREQINEGFSDVVTVDVVDGYDSSSTDGPHVVVYLGSAGGQASARCAGQIAAARQAGLFVLPVVEDLAQASASIPEELKAINAVRWNLAGGTVDRSLVHVLREELGLEERQRRVFISHRRSDALQMAEQLHDFLIKRRFDAFIDRFHIAPGARVQDRIEEALSEAAFVLFLESPESPDSEWVLEEIHYSLRHTLGMLIVSFPGVGQTAGTRDLPRHHLDQTDLVASRDPGQFVLAQPVLERIADEVEEIHAKSLVRRRNRLITHTRTAAERAGYTVDELPGSVLLVQAPETGPSTPAQTISGRRAAVVRFSPRPPRPEDLRWAHRERPRIAGEQTRAVLVHAEESLRAERGALLSWCLEHRISELDLVADSSSEQFWEGEASERQ